MHRPPHSSGSTENKEELAIRRGQTSSIPVVRLYWDLRALIKRARDQDALTKDQISGVVSDVITDLELEM